METLDFDFPRGGDGLRLVRKTNLPLVFALGLGLANLIPLAVAFMDRDWLAVGRHASIELFILWLVKFLSARTITRGRKAVKKLALRGTSLRLSFFSGDDLVVDASPATGVRLQYAEGSFAGDVFDMWLEGFPKPPFILSGGGRAVKAVAGALQRRLAGGELDAAAMRAPRLAQRRQDVRAALGFLVFWLLLVGVVVYGVESADAFYSRLRDNGITERVRVRPRKTEDGKAGGFDLVAADGTAFPMERYQLSPGDQADMRTTGSVAFRYVPGDDRYSLPVSAYRAPSRWVRGLSWAAILPALFFLFIVASRRLPLRVDGRVRWRPHDELEDDPWTEKNG